MYVHIVGWRRNSMQCWPIQKRHADSYLPPPRHIHIPEPQIPTTFSHYSPRYIQMKRYSGKLLSSRSIPCPGARVLLWGFPPTAHSDHLTHPAPPPPFLIPGPNVNPYYPISTVSFSPLDLDLPVSHPISYTASNSSERPLNRSWEFV